MEALIEGIRKGRFAVFGRAGMDMFADPQGTKAEHADVQQSGTCIPLAPDSDR